MREFFRRYVLNDLDLKVLALVISIALWWIVGRDPMVERVVTAPVQFRHAPDNLVMSSDTPFEVQVSVSGPERAIRALTAPRKSMPFSTCQEFVPESAPSTWALVRCRCRAD